MNTIRALSAATGELLWEEREPFFGTPSSEITVANGAVYVTSYYMGNDRTQHVYALDASTGAVLWKLSGGNWETTTPAVANGIAYVGCDPGSLCAFDASTGVLLWEYTAGGNSSVSPPAAADGVVYLGSVLTIARENRVIYLNALDARTGTLLWRRSVTASSKETTQGLLSTPAIANGIVYIGSGYVSPTTGRLYAFDASAGVFLWQYSFAGTLDHTSPSVANGVIYFGTWDPYHYQGAAYALDAHTGMQLWKYTFDNDGIYSSPAVANGMLFLGTVDYMYAFHLPGQ